MVIVLKFDVLYAEGWDMWQEMNVVHYETYIDTDHQMATEDKVEMYINNKLQARSTPGVDLIQGVDQQRNLCLWDTDIVDTTENESVVERRGDLQAWIYPCVR